MERLGELTFDDYDDDCQASAVELNNKDWCKPLQASLTRLAHMQPNVCNMYLQDAGSLKPPKSLTKFPKERRQQGILKQGGSGTKFSLCRDEEETSQNSTRSLSKATAWGSNSSIPDLLARQRSQPSMRPSSASRFPPRNRPDSAGLSRRPQSAKDSLSEKNKEVSKDLGIRGSKKQVDSRLPVLARCNSDLGVTSNRTDSDVTNISDSAMIESIHNCQDFAADPLRLGSKIQDKEDYSIREIDQDNSVENDEHIPDETCNHPMRASQEDYKPVTPPVPESIHFSLPNMNDGSDEDDRDDDELDTDRLLQQADSFMQKKSKEEQQVLNSLADANATIPKTKNSFDMDEAKSVKNFDSTYYYCADSSISKVAAHNMMSHDKVSHSNIKKEPTQRSPHVTWSDSHTICLFQKDSSSLLNGDLIQDMRPVMAVGNETESLSALRKAKVIRSKTGNRDHSSTETFKNQNQTCSSNTTNSFLMPDQEPISYKPLEVTKSGSGRKSLNIKKIPNSGKREISKKNSENERLTNPEDSQSSNSEIVNIKQSSWISSFSQNDGNFNVTTGQDSMRKLVPTVTLAYDDENEEEQQTGKQNGKKKLKKRKTFDEIETYMDKLDKEDSVKNMENLPSTFSSSCNCGEVSCGELLTQTHQPGPLWRTSPKSDASLITIGKTPVVKTTKTIEFCDGAAPSETVIKNTLVVAHEGRPEKLEPQQQSHARSLLMPSMIKRQQAPEDKLKPKPAVSKKIMSTDKKASTTMLSTNLVASEVDGNSTLGQREGGLAPPQPPHHIEDGIARDDQSDQGLYETLLEEAKSMALTSMIEAAKMPTPGKKETRAKLKSTSVSVAQETSSSSFAKPRPLSAPQKIASSKTLNMNSAPKNETSDKHKYCQCHISKPSGHTGIRRAQSAKPGRLFSRLDTLMNQEDNSPEMYHAQRMQMKMAAMGVQVDASVLERALFPPSGKSIYYNIPGDLPRNPTETLIPHYKHWLAEDYNRIKLMERRLARDDEIKYMQRVAAEKKALTQKKGKKKKRKEKLVTSAG